MIYNYNINIKSSFLFSLIVLVLISCTITKPDNRLRSVKEQSKLQSTITANNLLNKNGLKTGMWIDTTRTAINYTTYKNGIKQGEYLSFLKTHNTPIIKGYFDDNLENGYWIYYFKDAPRVKQKVGLYTHGHPIGLWETFTRKGKLLYDETYVYNLDSIGTYSSHTMKHDSTKFLWKEGSFFNYKKHGKWLCYRADKSIYWIENYIHGKKEGLYKRFFLDGSPKEITPYVNDNIHGTTMVYFENGQLKTSTSYINGLKEGKAEVYYRTGELKTITYYTNDKKHGTFKSFDQIGNLYILGTYENGLREGIWKSDPLDNTRYKQIFNFKNDKKHGQQVTYNNYYDIIEKTNFKHGVLEGKHIKFEHGKCVENYIYKQGLPTGIKHAYDDNGNLDFIVEYLDGKNNGIYKRFFFNGQVAYIGNYERGKLHGGLTEYYPNGRIKILENYKHGKKHGESIHYWNKPEPNIKAKTYYNENKIIGESYGYFKDGKLSLKTICKDSICVFTGYSSDNSIKTSGSTKFIDSAYRNFGIIKTYYDKNILESESEYKNGKQYGIYKKYHKNGHLDQSGQYTKNGKKIGLWGSYDKHGKLLKESYYSTDSTFTITYNTQGDTATYNKTIKYEGKQFTSFRKQLNHKKELITVSRTRRFNNEFEELTYFLGTGELQKKTWQTKDRKQFKHIEYNTKREVIYQSQKDDGLKTGEWITSNVRGVYKEIVEYKQNKKEGPATYYYPSGKLAKTCTFKQDNLIGEYTEYNENGNIKEIGSYNPIKNKTVTKTFYSDGAIQSIEKPKSKLTRSYESWFINGKRDESYTKIYEYVYSTDNGDYHGKYKSFYKNKQLQASRHYMKGELHGIEEEYFENGNRKHKGAYKYSKMHGKFTYYYKNGGKYYEAHYVNNIKNGPFKSWYENGQVEIIGDLKQNTKHGNWKEYYKNGQLKKVYAYILGSKSGKWITYDINGNIAFTETYPTSTNL